MQCIQYIGQFGMTHTLDTDNREKDISSPVAGSALRVTRTRTDRTFKGGMNGPAINEYVFVYTPLQGNAKEATANESDARPVGVQKQNVLNRSLRIAKNV